MEGLGKMKKNPFSILKNERGVSAIIVAVFILFVGIGIAAFAIDFGYRHVAQNELQNAADAGALAGARALYYEGGTRVNDDGMVVIGLIAQIKLPMMQLRQIRVQELLLR